MLCSYRGFVELDSPQAFSVQKRPCSVSKGGCVEASTQFWRFNAAAHYNGAHPALRVTADIIRAEPAKAIALGESLDSHQHARILIINIASEHSSVVVALKDKEASEMAGTSASGEPRAEVDSSLLRLRLRLLEQAI